MSVVTDSSEALRKANRRILVQGFRASGKTTLSVSASRRAGDTLPTGRGKRERIDCDDTLVIQGDNEGIMGAIDAGLVPRYVVDMADIKDWKAYQDRLVAALRELQGKLTDGTIRVVVIDLALPARLIDRSISPEKQKDWKDVANEGGRLFSALAGLRGVTVIGNAQLKPAIGMVDSRNMAANTTAEDNATARAIGGERATFVTDLPKGIATPWLDNASFVLTREAKRVKANDGTLMRTFKTHTQSSSKLEAKSRSESLLSPTEPGDRTLHALLRTAYGEDY